MNKGISKAVIKKVAALFLWIGSLSRKSSSKSRTCCIYMMLWKFLFTVRLHIVGRKGKLCIEGQLQRCCWGMRCWRQGLFRCPIWMGSF